MYQVTDENPHESVIESKNIVPIDETGPVRAYVEVAFKTDTNDLVLIGWLFDSESQVRGLSVLHQKRVGLIMKTKYRRPLKYGIDHVQL